MSQKPTSHAKARRLTALALLTALVIVLQTVASGIKIGVIPISLTLVPIVIGAILLGPGAGAFLGGVFGLITLIAGITATDAFTFTLWTASPIWTILVCIGKGCMAGLCAGLVAKAVKKQQFLSCVLSSLTAPIVNTGIFAIFMLTVFLPILKDYAGGSPALGFLLTGMIGINFVVELAVNAVLATAISRIVQAVSKQHH